MGTQVPHDIRIIAADGGRLALPGAQFVADVQMARTGADLMLTSADGHRVVVAGYFAQATPPDLVAPNGAKLTPQLVNAFTPSEHAGQYAANDTHTMTDASPAGRITAATGDAHIVRADGTRLDAVPGTPLFQNDVIETGKTGAVNMLFADHTAFAVGESARMSIDKYSYSDAHHSGSSFFSMLQGVFVYTSGLIGKNDPGAVNVETPVGTIGIRGTAFVGQVNPQDYGLHDPHEHMRGEHRNIIALWDGAGYVDNGIGETNFSKRFTTYSYTAYDAKPEHLADMNPKDFIAAHKTVFNLVDKPWWDELIHIYEHEHPVQQGLNERLENFLNFHYAHHMPAVDSHSIGGDLWAFNDATQHRLAAGIYSAEIWSANMHASQGLAEPMMARAMFASTANPFFVAPNSGSEPATDDIFTYNQDKLAELAKVGVPVDAGGGTDTLFLENPGGKGFEFDLTKVYDGLFKNFEQIELGHADGKSGGFVTLDAQSVFNFTGPDHTLTVFADKMPDESVVRVVTGSSGDDFHKVSGNPGTGDITFQATISGQTVTLVIQNQDGSGGHGHINTVVV